MSDRRDWKEVKQELDEEKREIADSRERFRKKPSAKAGLEVEYGVRRAFDSDLIWPVSKNGFEPGEMDTVEYARNWIIEKVDNAVKELGSSMIEIDAGPFDFMNGDTLGDVEKTINETEQEMKDVMNGDIMLQRLGAIPEAKPGAIPISNGERYHALIDRFADYLEKTGKEFVDGSNDIPVAADTPGGICSVQTNIQADSVKEGIKKANFVYRAQDSLMALTGNAPIIDSRETGYEDFRMPGWMESFNTEYCNKVGPWRSEDGWPKDLEDVRDRLDLEFKDSKTPLNDAIGEDWKYVRMKFPENSNDTREDVIVEARGPSVQDSAAGDVSTMAYLMGSAAWYEKHDDELEDFQNMYFESLESVNKNMERAMKNGLDTEFERKIAGETVTVDAVSAVREDIRRARRGLDYIGIEEEGYLDLLEERLYRHENGEPGTPADEYRDRIDELEEMGIEYEEAIKHAAPYA